MPPSFENSSAPEEHELLEISLSQEEEESRRSTTPQEEETTHRCTVGMNDFESSPDDEALRSGLNRRTLRKLDFVLLPFLVILFLLNSLDKSNIGNAESAGFTSDAGLSAEDLNIALAAFFAVFVTLQPFGAVLGRRYGMARFVPACMSLWGLCTVLHIFVRRRWQLILLRVIIAALESGFYATSVNYLSLFYTRGEFAVRLGVFYGQAAVAGILGSLLSWQIFRHFPDAGQPGLIPPREDGKSKWKSWEVLFLIEGCLTMVVALVGFFWLPHSADTAWFFRPDEKAWAEERIRQDRGNIVNNGTRRKSQDDHDGDNGPMLRTRDSRGSVEQASEDHHPLLADDDRGTSREAKTAKAISLTSDTGLSRHELIAAIFNYKIWHILACNILSAIPALGFSIFMPMVIKQLSPSLNLSPAASNLLSAPPFAFGAVTLFFFTRWSDRSQQRLVPVLWGLGLLLIGLLMTVLSPMENYTLRYFSLCVLLSGSYIASPLTVAWLSDNTPEPGKRAVLVGINGWGNLAGTISALIFTPADRATGYFRPLVITLVCVVGAFIGYIVFWCLILRENKRREHIVANFSEDERRREEECGDVVISGRSVWQNIGGEVLIARLLGEQQSPRRRGDERLTYVYGL